MKIVVLGRQGDVEEVPATTDQSVMEIIRSNSSQHIEAACGGCASCATCHIFVREDFIDRLPPVGEDEEALLSISENRKDNSRLACQIRMTDMLDGLAVEIAPSEDF